ncbi:DNA repair protein RecN [Anaerofustis sp. NSJ-163]|uniref:DNA repair protein RecN n=1 Tax=Anaerofustis sp. NSJ-163 TaxID=2944391 RepID=UPI00209BFB8E|nr:DNA repair protein RecN [Anaerofustis sp. NSJ-163]MCO8192869.1 DNA repair protein RecN [Anaerofustis sp. NSJ-163]
MLLSLNINNYAIIDNLSIEFDEGLNIITGETGAGKSIIIGALSLVLGEHAKTENIRTGKDKAVIQALFTVEENNHELKEVLDDLSIDYSDETLILTREISLKGRNICKINSTLVNVSTLKEVGTHLIDIHGQHEHQKLLNQNTHLSFLDSYGQNKIKEDLNKVSLSYDEYKKALKELTELEKKSKENSDNLDNFKRQFEEINEVDLEIGEDEELEKREKILLNSQNIYSDIDSAYSLLYKSDSNVLSNLTLANDSFSKVLDYDESVKENVEMLNEANTLIEEVVFFLRDYRDNISFNPEELNDIESKLNKINYLKKKYGVTIEEILEYKKELQNNIELIDNYEDTLNSLKKDVDKKKKEYLKHAKTLREKRKKIADEFCKKITENLQLLSMKGTVFACEFKDLEKNENYTKKGIDDIAFMISTNKGESLKPLNKIASGGEISRVMLSFKRILSENDNIDCLIFDEIDTGISGQTALIVGKQMWELSKNHQILAITHLPQIASMADTNYFIKKEVKDDKTFTSFTKLNEEEKVEELVRIISGENTSENAIMYAKDMIENADKLKNQ